MQNFINPRKLQVHQEPFFACIGVIRGDYHDIPSADVLVEDSLRSEPLMTYSTKYPKKTRSNAVENLRLTNDGRTECFQQLEIAREMPQRLPDSLQDQAIFTNDTTHCC